MFDNCLHLNNKLPSFSFLHFYSPPVVQYCSINFYRFLIRLFLNSLFSKRPVTTVFISFFFSRLLKTIFDFTLIRFISAKVVIKMCNSRFLLARNGKETLTSLSFGARKIWNRKIEERNLNIKCHISNKKTSINLKFCFQGAHC
jgi:hypothetical protein